MQSAVQVFKALADEGRFAVINLLLSNDLCVGGLARELKISEPAVSQHLKKLRECGLVTGEKRGYWTHYSVNTQKLLDITRELSSMAAKTRNPEGTCRKSSSAGECCCAAHGTSPVIEDLRSQTSEGATDE
ncbi:MAG: ArsR/SmtB family transcription factor [Solidesulfovibrio sp. DCME]|uniref:ArsR/SmtB family transcription factor n=1 Tax=Solidesulfovibrio sp. DCME TaxID=3447380 RepID=UPI003D142652